MNETKDPTLQQDSADYWEHHLRKDQHYRCPPCGCSLDQESLSKPGNCASCYMPLVPDNTGIKGSLDKRLIPFFQDGVLGAFYSKLIYPVFAIAILSTLFTLLLSFRGKSLNIFLTLYVLVISLYAFKNQLFGVQHGLTHSHRNLFIPLSFIMLMGPLIWAYTQSLLKPPAKWEWSYLIHLLPATIFFLGYTVLLLSPESTQFLFLSSPFEVSFGHFEQIGALVLGFAYWGRSWQAYAVWRESLFSNHKVLIKWMRRFLVVTGVFMLLWGVLVFFNYWLYDFGVATITYNMLWVVTSLLLLWLGFEIMSNPKFFLISKDKRLPKLALNEQEIHQHKLKLQGLMVNHKLYIDPALNLDKLAKAMEINPKTLSTFINGAMGTNFYDLVNCYRVEEVKRLLQDPSNKNLTIEAIAHHAGFNSKSTFNSAFKKYNKNMTPREFMKHLKNT